MIGKRRLGFSFEKSRESLPGPKNVAGGKIGNVTSLLARKSKSDKCLQQRASVKSIMNNIAR
jgi:hypothetical protein